MNSRHKHSLVFVLVLGFLGGVSFAVDIPAEAQNYFSLLDQTYSKAKTFQADVRLSVDIAMGKQTHSETLVSKLAWQKPNLIFVHSDYASSGTLMVSDGKKYFKFIPRQKEYIVDQAPDNIHNSDPMQSGVLGQLGGLTDIVSSDKPSKTIMQDLKNATMKNDAEIEGKSCAVIHLYKNVRNREVGIDVFIEKRTGRLIRMIFDNKAYLPQTEDAQNSKFTLVEEHLNIRIDEKIPEKTFVFNPPSGAKRVDKFSFSQKAKSPGAPDSEPASPVEGKPAPDFSLKDLNGETHSLSDYKGKFIALDFWASWCNPCKMELPILQKLAQKYASQDLALLTINNEDEKKVRNFLKTLNLDIPVLMDSTSETGRKYRVTMIPQLVLIDKNGVIRKLLTGLRSEEDLEREFQNLLNAK